MTVADLFALLVVGGQLSPAAVAAVIWWQHHRLQRIERKLWPDVFGRE